MHLQIFSISLLQCKCSYFIITIYLNHQNSTSNIKVITDLVVSQIPEISAVSCFFVQNSDHIESTVWHFLS